MGDKDEIIAILAAAAGALSDKWEEIENRTEISGDREQDIAKYAESAVRGIMKLVRMI
jgi:hypothetical protein